MLKLFQMVAKHWKNNQYLGAQIEPPSPATTPKHEIMVK